MEDIYIYIHFRLDTECADFEFDIIPIPPFDFIENNLSLEPYEYFGETIKIFGKIPKQIILHYNADILMKVKMIFKGDLTKYFKKRLESTYVELPLEMYLTISFDPSFRQTIIKYQKTILGNT